MGHNYKDKKEKKTPIKLLEGLKLVAQKLIVVGTLMGIQAYFLAGYDGDARQGLWFLPPPGPGTPAASLQRWLPRCDELLTGPKTLSLMLCQAIHGAAGTLAASWPAPCITGLNPFYPSASPLCLSLCLFSLVPQNCYAKLSRQRWGTSFELRRIQNLLSWRCWSDLRAVTSPETCTPPLKRAVRDLKPHLSQENLTQWLTFTNFPERW